MSLKTTPLDALHREMGARMVPFAGYDMPVQYPEGILAEHRFTRSDAGLFDVSHMGQFIVEGPGITATLESLVPVDLVALGEHQQTYALLTNAEGGVLDDLIITRWGPDRFFLVVNAACKAEDRAWIEAHLSSEQSLTELDDRALLALQGPAAREVLGEMIPAVKALTFMNGVSCELDGIEIYATCSGYTGEDGFELSVANSDAVALAKRLIDSPRVQPIGLGARDSLRLEAGLCWIRPRRLLRRSSTGPSAKPAAPVASERVATPEQTASPKIWQTARRGSALVCGCWGNGLCARACHWSTGKVEPLAP